MIDGKYEPHDITLLNHELEEHKLIAQGVPQGEAHLIVSEKYNYNEETKAFYGKIKKYRKE